jgi:L-fuconolactonase
MPVVDGQLHEPGPRLKWPEDPEIRNRLLTEMALAWMDSAGVDAALLQTSTDWGAYAAERMPDTFAHVPGFYQEGDGELPDYPAEVDRLSGLPGVKALRLFIGHPLSGENARRFERGAFDPLLAACEARSIPLFIFATRHLDLLPRAIEAYPDLTLIVDHIGLPQPPMDERESPPWRSLDSLLELARYPNVAVKLCGALSLSETSPPFDDVWPPLNRIVDAFGAERLLWASDQSRILGRIGFHVEVERALGPYPGKHTYAQSVDLYRDAQHLSDDQKRLILGGTLTRLVGWPASDLDGART